MREVITNCSIVNSHYSLNDVHEITGLIPLTILTSRNIFVSTGRCGLERGLNVTSITVVISLKNYNCLKIPFDFVVNKWEMS